MGRKLSRFSGRRHCVSGSAPMAETSPRMTPKETPSGRRTGPLGLHLVRSDESSSSISDAEVVAGLERGELRAQRIAWERYAPTVYRQRGDSIPTTERLAHTRQRGDSIPTTERLAHTRQRGDSIPKAEPHGGRQRGRHLPAAEKFTPDH
jgi:hypothetical protein